MEILELLLPSALESIDVATIKGADFARSCGFDDEALFAIDMAIRESVINAAKHGNKFDATKTVEITFTNQRRGLEIAVTDHGDGFDVADVPDPTNPENLLKTSGRGVLFIQSFMDEVEWKKNSDGGMTVKMCKLH